jgi:HEAT repeat protein
MRTIILSPALACILVCSQLIPFGPAGAAEPERPTASREEIRKLVDQLDAEEYAVREAATKRLMTLGETVVPAMQEALKSPSAEVRRRAQQVLDEVRYTVEKQLDRDYAELLKKEKDPTSVRKAAELFAGTNQSDRWTDYATATAELRRSRAKAGIPLLLKYMILHADFSSGHVVIPEYVDTFVILTGKEFANPYRYVEDRKTPVRNAVDSLVKTWWLPNKAKITTDLGAMEREQLQLIVDRLLKRAARAERDYGARDPAERVGYQLAAALHPERESGRRREAIKADLHPAMVPILLAAAGYEEKPPDQPAREDHAIPFAAIPMLAAFRKDGEAPILDKVAADARQNSAVRLLCLFALHVAGDDLDTRALLELSKAEKKLERRILILTALGHCSDDSAVPPLLEALDDRNVHVRNTGVSALMRHRPKAALPKLKKLLADPGSTGNVSAALDLVGEIGTREGQTILADFLKATQDGGGKSRDLYQALRAFQAATGQRWIEAGAHNDDYYRGKAKEALEWWVKQK